MQTAIDTFNPGTTDAHQTMERVLHVISSLSPAEGGPPEAVRQLVRAYNKAGVEVEVVCLDSPDEEFLRTVDCRVHSLGKGLLGRYALSVRLWRWLHKNGGNYDAIVVNGIWTFISVAARSAARHSQLPYGVFTHGALDPWFNRKYPLKRLKKLFYWPVQYPVLRDASAVFFTSDIERDLAACSFSPNCWRGVVVPYGIGDPDQLGEKTGEPAVQIKAFYEKVPAIRGRRYLLFLGRIHEKKGCDLLVQAFSRLASQQKDVDLVIAGPDQVGRQSKLQEMCLQLDIAGRVHWPGEIQGDLKWGAFRACDAFILPSHQENFGIAVVEALAVGRPVLISNKVNIWQGIVADLAGFAEDDTLEGTERMIRRWFALTPAERDECAAHARSTFLARYSIRRAVGVIVGELTRD